MKALLNILDTERGREIADEMRGWLQEKYEVVDFFHDGKQYEYPGIRKACEMSVDSGEPVLYIHTKGAANENSMQPIVRQMWRKQFVDNYDFYACHDKGLAVPELGTDMQTWFNAWIVWPDIAKVYCEKMVLSDDRYYYEALPRELGLKEQDIHYKVRCGHQQACPVAVELGKSKEEKPKQMPVARKSGKINILHIPSDIQGGVFYYRTLTPMTMLKAMFPQKYEVYITNSIDQAWKAIKETQILIVHNCMYTNDMQWKMWNLVTEAKKIGVKTVLDMDDYWNYGSEHPLIHLCINGKFPIKAPVNLNLFDYVTVTTERFKAEMLPYNKNVFVMENGISVKDTQFSIEKNPSRRVRVGFAGGASHISDIKEVVDNGESFIDYMSQADRDKMQVVLCGFNTEGKKIIYEKDGSKTEKTLKPDEVWWVKVEKTLTHDYKDVSPEYRELLLKYDRSDESFDASNEPYRRIWTKSIKDLEYGLVYKDMDVLLVPLADTRFNNMKSELKLIEAGFTMTTAIVSGVAPYIDYGKDGEDCLFVDKPTPRCWADKVSETLNDETLRTRLSKSMHERVVKERNLEEITKKRDGLFSWIVKN